MFESSWEVRGLGAGLRLSAATSTTVSFVLHGAGLIAISSGLIRIPAVQDPSLTERYSVRHVELHSPEPRQAKPKIEAPQTASNGAPHAPSPALPKGGGHDKQTLVQPGFHTHDSVQLKAPVPSVVVWTPELATDKNIVLPAPNAPTSAEAPPSIESPNEELQAVSDPVSCGRLTPLVDMQPPGTTSPMISKTDSEIQMAPSTMSRSEEQPTPAAVLSVSDLRMREGSVVLPPVNQLHGPDPESRPGGESVAAAQPSEPLAPAPQPATGTPTEENRDAAAAQLNAVHVELPKDGRFGFVAIGSMDGEQYPEAFEMWNGRVAYTAYLHVGLSKSWVMQYAQTRAADAQSSGVVARLEAPWPYDILRPNLSSSQMTTDALIVHGTLSEAGKFESLAIAFPTKFPGADTVLQALKEWQFRPARQQGKAVSVEILLIIPDQSS